MNQTHFQTLKQKFSGEIILPEEAAYEKARASYTRKGSPAIVLRPKNSADVATAIRYARNNSLIISIRSGGHSVAGHSTNDGGLVVDLSAINSVDIIDKQKHIVRIGSGATWITVAIALQEHGLALSSGDSTTVGVGGLVLGGGIGWMVRKYGLTIDNLKAAEIVTADGKILRTSVDEHPDLFWAIRGGGGNLGVVTYFEFVAASVTDVYSGTIIYALEDLSSLLKKWRDHMRRAPDELTVMFLLMPAFFGNPPSALAWCCYAGSDEAGAKKAIDPLLNIGSVVQNNVVKKPYSAVLEEPHPPEGVKITVKNGFVQNVSDELIDAIVSTHCKESSPALQLRSVGGMMNRIDPAATAFAHRSSEVLMISAAFVPMDATEEETTKAMIPWKTIAPYTSGAYVNFFSTTDDEDIAEAYPKTTYERLAKIKSLYDPGNIFNQNFNILTGG